MVPSNSAFHEGDHDVVVIAGAATAGETASACKPTLDSKSMVVAIGRYLPAGVVRMPHITRNRWPVVSAICALTVVCSDFVTRSTASGRPERVGSIASDVEP